MGTHPGIQTPQMGIHLGTHPTQMGTHQDYDPYLDSPSLSVYTYGYLGR
jgi:hypothetical protein